MTDSPPDSIENFRAWLRSTREEDAAAIAADPRFAKPAPAPAQDPSATSTDPDPTSPEAIEAAALAALDRRAERARLAEARRALFEEQLLGGHDSSAWTDAEIDTELRAHAERQKQAAEEHAAMHDLATVANRSFDNQRKRFLSTAYQLDPLTRAKRAAELGVDLNHYSPPPGFATAITPDRKEGK